MSHCIVSLTKAGKFEKLNGIDWDPVCTDKDSAHAKNVSSDEDNEKSMY